MDRRRLLATAIAAAALPALGLPATTASAATWDATVDTLDAFTDTLIPGAKRFPGDTAVAGAADGPGGADAGFISLITDPRTGLAPFLDAITATLNTRTGQQSSPTCMGRRTPTVMCGR